MTVDDQIRDEKLQYDINAEAAKTSASSSGKIDKYEYRTGEGILPSNQKQIIEQAKFSYSPLGKYFEKQTKRIDDQGKKQDDILKTLKPKELKAIEDKSDDNEKHLKFKKVFNEYSNERIGEIHNISKKMNFDNLTYHFKGSNTETINSIDFGGPTHIYSEIKNGNISVEKVEVD